MTKIIAGRVEEKNGNQRVIGESRKALQGSHCSRADGDKNYKAGSTRDIGAAFQPEGGIFFRLRRWQGFARQRP